jgi:hypothetical protein
MQCLNLILLYLLFVVLISLVNGIGNILSQVRSIIYIFENDHHEWQLPRSLTTNITQSYVIPGLLLSYKFRQRIIKRI